MAKPQPQNPYQIYPDAGESFPFWGSPVYVADDNTAQPFGAKSGELYCPGFVGQTYADSIWDKIMIGVPFVDPGQPFTPGLCQLQVHKGRDVDKKKAVGSDGARYTVHGIDPAMVEIHVLIWTPQQYLQLIEMWKTLFPGPTKQEKTTKTPITTQVVLFGGTPGQTISIPTGRSTKNTTSKTVQQTTPFDVSHPELDMHGIKSLLFVEGDGPNPGPIVRSRVFTMKALEFLQPTKTNATKTPTASKGTVFDPGKQSTPGSNPKNWAP